MAVKLRLKRMGKKKQPFYRIVATDSRVARDGKYIEKVGHYNPLVDPPEVLVDEEKALLWLSRGAIPSDTVKSLLSRKGILLKWHLQRSGLPQDRIEEEMKKWEVLQIEKKRKDEALEIQSAPEEIQTSEESEEVTIEEPTEESQKDEQQESNETNLEQAET